jgi:hypothetical protein
MATDLGLGGVLGSIAGIATGGSASSWISLGINLIVSSIVGGIVLLVVMEILEKGWGESIHVGKVFIFMLVINAINYFGVVGFITPYISFIPYSYMIVSVLLWIGLMKAFFGEMSMKHAVITGVIGFILSMFVIPTLVGMVQSYIPF